MALPIFLGSCLVLAVLALPGCATTYSAKPIAATVVDAETGQPLEGVNVVAHWVLHTRAWRITGDLELMEAVTDKHGKFHIPGWGPKRVPDDLPRGTRLGNSDPALIFFKSGYRDRTLGNDLQPNRLRPENDIRMRYSDWDGKAIKLEKFRGDLQFYALGITTGVGSGMECPWKKAPRFFSALVEERARLDRMGIRGRLPTLADLENWFSNAGCGSAREFFREYLR